MGGGRNVFEGLGFGNLNRDLRAGHVRSSDPVMTRRARKGSRVSADRSEDARSVKGGPASSIF